jgi:hypothetical protein
MLFSPTNFADDVSIGIMRRCIRYNLSGRAGGRCQYTNTNSIYWKVAITVGVPGQESKAVYLDQQHSEGVSVSSQPTLVHSHA